MFAGCKIKFGGGVLVILANLAALAGLAAALIFCRSEFNELEQFYQELKTAEVQTEDFNNLRRLVAETEVQRRLLNSYFVRIADLTSFIERLENLATSTEISLNFTKVDVGRSAQDLPSAEFVFRANGPFTNLSRFLVLLEALPLELQLRRAALVAEPPRNAGLKGEWKGEFVLEVAGLSEDYVEQD